jgi:hypothetical protein
MTQQRSVIADKSFILAIRDCCRPRASRATRRSCLQRALYIKATWIDAKEGRKPYVQRGERIQHPSVGVSAAGAKETKRSNQKRDHSPYGNGGHV